MGWVGELGVAVGHSVAGMALAVVCYGLLERLGLRSGTRSLFVGIAFGMAGCLMMTTPMPIADGVIIDGRFLSVGLAAAFGGWPATLVSVLIVGLFRASLDGHGATMGVASIVFTGIVGLMWQRFVMARWTPDSLSMTLFGAVLSTHTVFIAFIPVPNALMLMVHTWMMVCPMYLIGAPLFGLMMNRETSIIRKEAALNSLSSTDHLTRLPNRRFFSNHLAAACQNERDGGDGFAVLLLDIDHFKRVNDTLGHDAGDDALRAIAEVLARDVSKYDLACRYGGEEFAVFLLYSSPSQGVDKAEKLRKRIEALELNCGGRSFSVTVSIGVCGSYGLNHDPALIMKNADECLYKAKRAGRNRVVSSDGFDRGLDCLPELASAA